MGLRKIAGLAVLLAGLFPVPGFAQTDEGADFAFVQRPGDSVTRDLAFEDTDGRTRRLGDLLAGRPALLALGYFHCPSLCSVVRDDLLDALVHTGLKPGADYELLVVSIDPSETAAAAAPARTDDLVRYPLAGAETGWHFLRGDAAAVARLQDEVGFKSRYDVHLKQFLHPAGVVILTGEGRVSGYVLGVGYKAGDIAAALTRAASGGIGQAALPILLLCFHYDEATGRYTLAIMKILRLAGLLTIATIGGTLLLLFRRSRKA